MKIARDKLQHTQATRTHSRSKPTPAARGHIPALAPVIDKLESLTGLDNWRNCVYIGIDWLVIAAVIAGSILSHAWPAYLVALFVIASRMRALMNLTHQCSHRQLFRNRLMNNWVGRLLVAWPLGINVSAYRDAHDDHHNLLWDKKGDPEVAHYEELGLLPPERRMKVFVLKYIVAPRFLLHVPQSILGVIMGKGESRREWFGKAGYWLAVWGIAILTGTIKELLLYWLIPYATTFHLIRFWSETAEHVGLDGSSPWTATRNWTSNIVVRWFLAPHSDHWHLVHHLYSGIPHYNLPQAHRILMHVPEYADNAHLCDGFFFSRRPDAASVIQDIVHPEALSKYKLTGDERIKIGSNPRPSQENRGIRPSIVT
jgi:fatty acid desaturase